MADNSKLVIIGAAIGIGFLAALTSKRAHAGEPPMVLVPLTPENKWGPPLALGKNFDLGEFLRSGTFPQLARYRLTDSELANVKALVEKVLQPIRDKYGPVLITSGGRPGSLVTAEAYQTTSLAGKPIVIPPGSNFQQAMKLKGYNAAEHSDHQFFAAVNFELWDAQKKLDSTGMEKAFADLKVNDDVRQVILYRTADGRANNIHVAVVYPGHGRLTGDEFAFEDKAQ